MMERRLPGVNDNTSVLKVIALVCMVIDHVGVVFFPGSKYQWMRVIGRIAFPLYCWCLVVGVEYTRNLRKYALRLFVLFLVSQPLYMSVLDHPAFTIQVFSLTIPWIKPNIFMTLLMGLVAIYGIRSRTFWPTVLALVISHSLGADYGLRGVLCVVVLYLLRKNPLALALGYAAFCVVWGESAQYLLKTPWFTYQLYWGGASAVVYRSANITLRLQHCAVLALPLVLLPMRGRPRFLSVRLFGRIPVHRLFYWAYPGHLAILWVIKQLIA